MQYDACRNATRSWVWGWPILRRCSIQWDLQVPDDFSRIPALCAGVPWFIAFVVFERAVQVPGDVCHYVTSCMWVSLIFLGWIRYPIRPESEPERCSERYPIPKQKPFPEKHPIPNFPFQNDRNLRPSKVNKSEFWCSFYFFHVSVMSNARQGRRSETWSRQIRKKWTPFEAKVFARWMNNRNLAMWLHGFSLSHPWDIHTLWW